MPAKKRSQPMATTKKGRKPKRPCRCSDPGCPVHKGKSTCAKAGVLVLRRVDMDDRTGTRMCRECAADALESGLF